jgi:hypothetical protein
MQPIFDHDLIRRSTKLVAGGRRLLYVRRTRCYTLAGAETLFYPVCGRRLLYDPRTRFCTLAGAETLFYPVCGCTGQSI